MDFPSKSIQGIQKDVFYSDLLGPTTRFQENSVANAIHARSWKLPTATGSLRGSAVLTWLKKNTSRWWNPARNEVNPMPLFNHPHRFMMWSHTNPKLSTQGPVAVWAQVLYDFTRLVMPEHVQQNLESYMQAIYLGGIPQIGYPLY
jgi:hypothetical protein